jgi:hypothetical protein
MGLTRFASTEDMFDGSAKRFQLKLQKINRRPLNGFFNLTDVEYV